MEALKSRFYFHRYHDFSVNRHFFGKYFEPNLGWNVYLQLTDTEWLSVEDVALDATSTTAALATSTTQMATTSTTTTGLPNTGMVPKLDNELHPNDLAAAKL